MGILLLLLVMLLMSQNFSALLSFLEIACIDYKRREVLLVHLKDQIRPKLSRDETGEFKIQPKALDLKLGNNSIAYLALRQTIRELGKNIDYGCNGWLAMLFFFKLLSCNFFVTCLR